MAFVAVMALSVRGDEPQAEQPPLATPATPAVPAQTAPAEDQRPVAPKSNANSGADLRRNDEPAAPMPNPEPRKPRADRLTLKDLRRVDAGMSDVGVLDGGLRSMPNDLRVPNNFAGVYQVPRDADTPYAGWFVRISGSVWAVFPQSVYKRTRDGISIPVPPGTKFFLGGIPLGGRSGATPLNQDVPELSGAPEDSRVNTGVMPLRPDATSALPSGAIGEGPISTRVLDAEQARERSKTSAIPTPEDAAGAGAEKTSRGPEVNAEKMLQDQRYRERRLAEIMLRRR